MKSLALRAFALILLGWLAHTVKPFTSENLTSYAAATAHSFAAWLPAAATARWERTAALASVLSNAWTAEGEFAARREWVLAARLQPSAQPSSTQSRQHLSPLRRSKPAVRGEVALEPFSSAAADTEESAENEEAVPSTEESIHSLIQLATQAAPLPLETGTLPGLSLQKRAACPMPSVADTTESVTAPAAPRGEEEAELAPTVVPEMSPMPVPQKSPWQPLESAMQPVRFYLKPSQAPVRLPHKRTLTVVSKC